MTEFAGTTRFRLFIDDDRAEPFVLITEPYGREIPLDPGTWVDVEVNNGDGTPAEVWCALTARSPCTAVR